jgi:Pectic acid lyase
MRKQLLPLLVVVLLVQNGFGAEETLERQAKAALQKAATYFHSISTNGGYVGRYSLDLKKRYGEALREPAKATEIWIQPPGTPSVGECFLRAYKTTGKKQYLKAATDTARALAWAQKLSGGWGHLADVSHMSATPDKPILKRGTSLFDDNITQGALSFLISLDEVVDEPWLTGSIEYGLKGMIEAQFENGAWPQRYPLPSCYGKHYTFNDSAINDCIRVMLRAHKVYGREEYLQSAKRGGDFIILSQLPHPQSGWAQQYSHDLQPSNARSFEPRGVCSAVASHNIRTLVDIYLYTKDEKYLEPISDAVEWLEKSKIGDNRWARLYEVKSNRPIYGDRTKPNRVFYDYEKISAKEKKSYSWQGDYGVKQAIAYYNAVKTMGVDDYLAKASQPLTTAQRAEKLEKLSARAKDVIARLNDKGQWIRNDMMFSADFVRNMNTLCGFLELVVISQHNLGQPGKVRFTPILGPGA